MKLQVCFPEWTAPQEQPGSYEKTQERQDHTCDAESLSFSRDYLLQPRKFDVFTPFRQFLNFRKSFSEMVPKNGWISGNVIFSLIAGRVDYSSQGAVVDVVRAHNPLFSLTNLWNYILWRDPPADSFSEELKNKIIENIPENTVGSRVKNGRCRRDRVRQGLLSGSGITSVFIDQIPKFRYSENDFRKTVPKNRIHFRKCGFRHPTLEYNETLKTNRMQKFVLLTIVFSNFQKTYFLESLHQFSIFR